PRRGANAPRSPGSTRDCSGRGGRSCDRGHKGAASRVIPERVVRLTVMSRRNVRSIDPLSRPTLTVVSGGASEGSTTGPSPADATDHLASTLIDAFGDRVLFLFHRRIPGQTGDLPVIAVTASGVHLIEPRSYPGKKVRACRDG